MATAATRKITAEEFLAMDLGEGLHELVRGEIVEVPPPGPKHGLICTNVGAILRNYGRQAGHGYALGNDSVVSISGDTVRGADIQYFREDRFAKARVGDAPPPVPPDRAVEVLSPSNSPGDMRRKVNDYLDAGVAMVWVLDPERASLTLYRHDEIEPRVFSAGDVLEGLPELPGFGCRVGEFFE